MTRGAMSDRVFIIVAIVLMVLAAALAVGKILSGAKSSFVPEIMVFVAMTILLVRVIARTKDKN